MQNLFSGVGLLFETSWEVCNKIGGIYTVLSTKANELCGIYGSSLVFVGPDVNQTSDNSAFLEDSDWLLNLCGGSIPDFPGGVSVRAGYWDVPGRPQVVLVDFKSLYSEENDIYGEMWRNFGVDSLHGYGDYGEGVVFSTAVAKVISSIIDASGVADRDVIAHFNEWTTAAGLLYMEAHRPGVATVFTTHATSIGRSICGNNKPLYDYFEGYHGDQMARELNMEAKHSLEKAAAHAADCFTTVSDVTAAECKQLLDIAPQVVTPNGFEPNFVVGGKEYAKLRREGRKRILEVVSVLTGKDFGSDAFIVATSGRNEYRNKGLDVYLDSVARAIGGGSLKRDVVALVLVPSWVKGPSAGLLKNLRDGNCGGVEPSYLTHRLNNEGEDRVSRRLGELNPGLGSRGCIIDVPCYLDGADGILNISYYDLLPALDLTVFASYYEPWGYTPLESVAFGVPTVSTDKAGFGQWVLSNYANTFMADGAEIVARTDSNYEDVVVRISDIIVKMSCVSASTMGKYRRAASRMSRDADWKNFIRYYEEAFEVAARRRDERLEQDNNRDC